MRGYATAPDSSMARRTDADSGRFGLRHRRNTPSSYSDYRPAADEQATVDGWLAQVENLEGDFEAIRDEAKSNDIQGVENVLSKATRRNAKSRQLATQLGMKVCNEDED
jgi:hypothetical protein